VKVSELGEFGLIDRLAEMAAAGHQGHFVVGIGDDAAGWRSPAGIQLATTDALVEDVHFTLATTSWEDLGWKSLAANLSDIAAMGGRPEHVLVTLGLPGYAEVEDALDFYRGMIALADEHGAVIAGGDTVSAGKVFINITVLGAADAEGRLLTRSTALKGDKVAVTGSLGAAAGGAEMLLLGLTFPPDIEAELQTAFCRPRPRVREGQQLVELGVTTGMDISDGLVADLNHICRASRVGARIEAASVPVPPSLTAAFADGATGLALTGGEDYELLFTADAARLERVRETLDCPVTIIGEITAAPAEVIVVNRQGGPVELPGAGWDHFSGG
jgi:thiamine-monophosphate kinase